MDGQDHKMTAPSAGHEGHGTHLCHRCGWPFPNPHPSAKHRRAHKKVCGTIEGYKIIHSEEHDQHLAVSDDEHGSDENEHTPSPMVVKKNAEFASASGGVGGKSNKSEDDMFSDAVTEFSDSGISPHLEEQFKSVRGVDKSVEEKSVESDLYPNDSLKVDENADRTEKFDDPTRSDETSNPGAPVNAKDQSGSAIPITDTSAEAVSVELVNRLQQDCKSEMPRDLLENNGNECGDGDKQGEEDKLASLTLDSEEGKISDPALTATEELCDKSVSELVEHDLPCQNETPQNSDASAEVKSVAHSVQISSSTGTGSEIPLAEETHENADASLGVKEVCDSTEDMPSVKPSHAAELSNTVLVDKEVNLVGGENAVNFDENNNQNVESKDNSYVEKVSISGSIHDTFVREDDQTTMGLKKDEDNCEESSNDKLLEARNEKCEGASVEEVQVISDSTMPIGSGARNLEQIPINESCSLESRDNGSEKSIQELRTCNVTEGVESVDSELNRDTKDVLDKSSPAIATFEGPVSPAISELPNNVHLTNNDETVTNSEVLASERTPEEPVPKESISLFTDSESSSKKSAYDNSCIGDVAKASESVAASEVIAEQNSESRALTMQESSPVQKCLNENSPEVEKNSIKDNATSKSIGIVPSEELTYNGNVVTSDKCLKDSQDLHKASAALDDKNISNVEHDSGVDSKSLQDEVKQKDDVSATGSSCSISDSLEGNVGSVSALSSQSNMAIAETNSQSSDTLANNSQKHKTTAVEANPNKPDDFEPPSFMTLVQSRGEGDKVTADSEIETVQHNQQPKSDALKAGWFPSVTNVVNKSEGRKKNEEMIAKVTNWSPVKQHGPLKNLLSEVKSPNEKQVPPRPANLKEEPETKDNGAGVTTVSSFLGPDAPPAPNKDVEEWNSPARYPIEIKKEKKKKGRSYWVPFVCCSSVHRDL
ncbi:hypothetical protein CDL12_08241 [Handroanthus impetiginosus]|uniref:C2H2-type domain-containing protein n=1 Tax=Handroanthus impetiginosus TaxID=429701 RepID=A0A2G9HNH9_9LAMI|nr:hypothetical protein CDL12_08241 [Handroanthus impetiginosus]